MSFEFPRADKPENVGLSSPRLARIRDALQADIAKGVVPGAVALVIRRGQIASLDALGYRDSEAGAVMKSDTIFRIALRYVCFHRARSTLLAASQYIDVRCPDLPRVL
jgi:CubicO group peptidase (beta-lactamase class C family)